MKASIHCAVAIVFLSSGLVIAASQNGVSIPTAGEQLLQQFPGLQVHTVGHRVRVYYGVPMTSASTPELAAEWWLQDHADAFGVANPDYRLVRSNEVGIDGRLTVFVYQQYMEDIPVEFGTVRLVVRNGEPSSVVYAAARVALAPSKGLPVETVNADDALTSVQSLADYAHLTEWTEPQLAVIFSEATGEEDLTLKSWKFQGTQPDLTSFDSQSFFVDASTGELVHVRSEVHYDDIDGAVSGMATPGTLPDVPYNLPVETTMEDVFVEIPGEQSTYTDEAGNYVLSDVDSGVNTVRTELLGHWVDVNTNQGSPLVLTTDATAPATVDFLYNASPSQFATAQVNAHIHTTLVHDFYKDRAPSYTGLDIPIPANTNLTSSCNAFFSSDTINFYNAAGGCPNTAYSTVVAHEYGHFIVDQHGLGQGSYGEGYGDSVAILLYDDPIVARDFFGPGTFIRDIEGANKQYPCFDEIHDCGQVLAGVWWDINLNLEPVMGDAEALAFTQQLLVDWSEITGGGSGNDSAHPETAIEVLTVDDDDGYIGNGTPNRTEICAAFGKHNIPCPELDAIAFVYPDGLPELLTAGVETTIRVNVVAVDGTPVPGTGTVTYQIANGGFVTEPMVELNPNEYEATLPAVECPQRVDFYFGANAVGEMDPITDPADAPATTYSAVASIGVNTIVMHDFETNPGWVGTGDAPTGDWQLGVPIADNRGDPPTDYDGSGQCWVTDNSDDGDIDDGTVILTSTVYDLNGLNDPHVSYARWYSNTFGALPEADIFEIEVSDDAGGSWTELETVGPAGPEVDGGWFYKTFRIADFVTPNDQFRIRFIASDFPGQGSVVEAAVDAFLIFDYLCDGTGECEGDVNGDNVVDPLDSGFVLARLGCSVGAGDPDCDASDLNFDGVVDPLDVGFVLSRLGDCP